MGDTFNTRGAPVHHAVFQRIRWSSLYPTVVTDVSEDVYYAMGPTPWFRQLINEGWKRIDEMVNV